MPRMKLIYLLIIASNIILITIVSIFFVLFSSGFCTEKFQNVKLQLDKETVETILSCFLKGVERACTGGRDSVNQSNPQNLTEMEEKGVVKPNSSGSVDSDNKTVNSTQKFLSPDVSSEYEMYRTGKNEIPVEENQEPESSEENHYPKSGAGGSSSESKESNNDSLEVDNGNDQSKAVNGNRGKTVPHKLLPANSLDSQLEESYRKSTTSATLGMELKRLHEDPKPENSTEYQSTESDYKFNHSEEENRNLKTSNRNWSSLQEKENQILGNTENKFQHLKEDRDSELQYENDEETSVTANDKQAEQGYERETAVEENRGTYKAVYRKYNSANHADQLQQQNRIQNSGQSADDHHSTSPNKDRFSTSLDDSVSSTEKNSQPNKNSSSKSSKNSCNCKCSKETKNQPIRENIKNGSGFDDSHLFEAVSGAPDHAGNGHLFDLSSMDFITEVTTDKQQSEVQKLIKNPSFPVGKPVENEEVSVLDLNDQQKKKVDRDNLLQRINALNKLYYQQWHPEEKELEEYLKKVEALYEEANQKASRTAQSDLAADHVHQQNKKIRYTGRVLKTYGNLKPKIPENRQHLEFSTQSPVQRKDLYNVQNEIKLGNDSNFENTLHITEDRQHSKNAPVNTSVGFRNIFGMRCCEGSAEKQSYELPERGTHSKNNDAPTKQTYKFPHISENAQNCYYSPSENASCDCPDQNGDKIRRNPVLSSVDKPLSRGTCCNELEQDISSSSYNPADCELPTGAVRVTEKKTNSGLKGDPLNSTENNTINKVTRFTGSSYEDAQKPDETEESYGISEKNYVVQGESVDVKDKNSAPKATDDVAPMMELQESGKQNPENGPSLVGIFNKTHERKNFKLLQIPCCNISYVPAIDHSLVKQESSGFPGSIYFTRYGMPPSREAATPPQYENPGSDSITQDGILEGSSGSGELTKSVEAAGQQSVANGNRENSYENFSGNGLVESENAEESGDDGNSQEYNTIPTKSTRSMSRLNIGDNHSGEAKNLKIEKHYPFLGAIKCCDAVESKTPSAPLILDSLLSEWEKTFPVPKIAVEKISHDPEQKQNGNGEEYGENAATLAIPDVNIQESNAFDLETKRSLRHKVNSLESCSHEHDYFPENRCRSWKAAGYCHTHSPTQQIYCRRTCCNQLFLKIL